MYYVYALTTKNKDRIYVGLTNNLKTRVKGHNSGNTKSTKCYRPWNLFHHEKFNLRSDARAREKKLKSSSGKEFLKKKLKLAPIAQLDRAHAF